MAGVKGQPGRPPKRSDQRRRRNPTQAEKRGGVRAGEAIPADPPPPGKWEHAIKQWYDSLGRSGQSGWYSAADWSSAWLMADLMNCELLADGAVKAATVANWLKLNTALLATEGDRRRAAIELQRPSPPEDEPQSSVTSLASWKESLSG